MNPKKLETELSKLTKQPVNIGQLLNEARALKTRAIERNDEVTANKMWVIHEILTAHQHYQQAFQHLKMKRYLEGWNALERAEVDISFIKKHIHLVKENYGVKLLENMISRFQCLFPYRLFGSSELLEKEVICSICNKKLSLRNPCGHKTGMLYMGELCLKIVTKSVFLGLALVETPVHKYSVMFNESEDQKFRDEVQFQLINYILNIVEKPYDHWRVIVSEKYFPHRDNLSSSSVKGKCPCDSGQSYQDCCLSKPGIHGYDYDFRVGDTALARSVAKSRK